MTYALSESIGKTLDYSTEKQIGNGSIIKTAVTVDCKRKEDLTSVGDAALLNELFENNGTARDEKAYEWLGVGACVQSDEPCCWVLSYEDYYTAEQYDSRNIVCGAGESFHYKTAEFSLSYENAVYENCRMVLIIHHPRPDGQGAPCEMCFDVFYCVPAGYDGCVLGFHNSAALTKEQLELGMTNPAASLGFIQRTVGDLYIRLGK